MSVFPNCWTKKNKAKSVLAKQKQEDATDVKPSRATCAWIAKPSLYLNPYKYYRLYMDVIFMESAENIGLRMSGINEFLNVNYVQYDHSSQVVRVALQEKKTDSLIAWDYLVERLKSYGNVKYNDWAETIKEYCLSYERIHKICTDDTIGEILDELIDNSFEMDPIEKRQELLTNDALIIVRYGRVNDKFVKKEIMYNENFLTLVGHDVDTIIKYTLTEGIPEMFAKSDTSDERYQYVLRNIFNSKKVNKMRDAPTYLLTRNHQKKPVIEKMHLFSEYSKETGYEAELVFSFKPDDSRVTVQLKEPEFNSERVEELESKEKDIQSFMKKFYGQNYIGMIYNSKKICRVKYLH